MWARGLKARTPILLTSDTPCALDPHLAAVAAKIPETVARVLNQAQDARLSRTTQPGDDAAGLYLGYECSGRLLQLGALVTSLIAKGETDIVVFCHLPAAAETIVTCMAASPNDSVRWLRVSAAKSTGAAQSSKRQTQKYQSRQADTAMYRQWCQKQSNNATETADGRGICFNYNRRPPRGCEKAQCAAVHVCDRYAPCLQICLLPLRCYLLHSWLSSYYYVLFAFVATLQRNERQVLL